MFLAWNEIKHSKTRFILIISVMVLVSYLVFFLGGLAYGLAQANRTSVDNWKADGIILNSEANGNLTGSTIDLPLAKKVKAKKVTPLGQSTSVATIPGQSDKVNIQVFGVMKNQFISPEITEGNVFSKKNDVVVDDSLKENGIAIGDTFSLSNSDEKLKVTGFTTNSKFNTAPVVYMSLANWQDLKFTQKDPNRQERASALIIKDNQINQLKSPSKDQIIYNMPDFINKIPGYKPQNLTFGLMIGFLFVIAAFVIGIFIYVLTLQKVNMFGVMKAQGIPTSYIARGNVAQTFILATIGVAIGLSLTSLTAVLLPSAVPYQTNYLFLGAFSLVLIGVAILGSLFSVRTIVKIDPLQAIGG
ncbi:ABC transporter permease [Vagococcus intermedius]|uniref:Putative hemin transport system permease protein HrtB n=1 Tax=Vagococcus intermedius TaxID=2991418 RepID=A0AAF0CT41_9ENTE|nr:ABC transporter permease [Vagococcus intermedius]WEG72423.1 ABC transporter permease [Vagococcus intermedius]WEG74510.1 ABC transporter permease [Vagococcus intermedius]